MPRVTVKARLGKRSDKVHAAVRKALATSTECVLVVYGQDAANIYYEGSANHPPSSQKDAQNG